MPVPKALQTVTVTIGRVPAQQILNDLRQGRKNKNLEHCYLDLLDQLEAQIGKGAVK